MTSFKELELSLKKELANLENENNLEELYKQYNTDLYSQLENTILPTKYDRISHNQSKFNINIIDIKFST